MSTLTQQRCFNHAVREAVARCPECRQFFCRECITEHEDRVICAACLKKLVRRTSTRGPILGTVIRLAQLVVSVLVAWFFFFLIGESLARLPTSFHEGEVWHVPWMDEK